MTMNNPITKLLKEYCEICEYKKLVDDVRAIVHDELKKASESFDWYEVHPNEDYVNPQEVETNAICILDKIQKTLLGSKDAAHSAPAGRSIGRRQLIELFPEECFGECKGLDTLREQWGFMHWQTPPPNAPSVPEAVERLQSALDNIKPPEIKGDFVPELLEYLDGKVGDDDHEFRDWGFNVRRLNGKGGDDEPELVELRPAEFNAKCNVCGRKTVSWERFCGMTRPDGSECNGEFVPMDAPAKEDE
jgi:hypothetical protein